jgi:hypothetical protein
MHPQETQMQLPKGMAYGNWDFPISTLRDLTFEIEIRGNVDRYPGRYLQLYQGDIAGIGCYFGLQTDVAKPGYGGQGHGLLFSRWKTRDSSNARVAPNGWIENAGHEGGFVGVRTVMPWSAGKYRCTLAVVNDDVNGVWYEFAVMDHNTNETYSVGALRFPAAEIKSGGGTWTEVYSFAKREEDVPETELRVLSIAANGMTVRPIRCRVSYQEFSRSDAFVDDSILILRSGGKVVRTHEAKHYDLDA